MTSTAPEIFDLFPTPVMRVPAVLAPHEAQALRVRLGAGAEVGNNRSGALTHTRLLGPGQDSGVDVLVDRMGPHLQAFGTHLFGETLRWLVKEIWVNVLRTSGQQSVHNHANCFVSGIVYLTESDESARTVFLRSMGGSDFVFRNAHAGTQPGPYSAEKWMAPSPQAGDLILFPSYLLHEVPLNRGDERVTLAFNAIPHRLDAWGYGVSFAP
jgi:uncharacterized protein (TIGR02466 family)